MIEAIRWFVAFGGCLYGATVLVYVPGTPTFSWVDVAIFLTFGGGGILIGPRGSRVRLLGFIFVVVSLGEGLVLVELIRQSVGATDSSGPSVVNYLVVSAIGLLSNIMGWTIIRRFRQSRAAAGDGPESLS